MCCEVQHVSILNRKRVCCVLDMGEVLGGFLRSPSFDIFGPEIRGLLNHLMILPRGGIFCSASMCKTKVLDLEEKGREGTVYPLIFKLLILKFMER